MQAVIVNFRSARHHQRGNQMVLLVPGVSSRAEAEKLVGKSVRWTAPGKAKKLITGVITAPHGSKGAVRARFERGMPGQAVGQKVELD